MCRSSILDAQLLMWSMRRNLNTDALPPERRCVIQFQYPEQPVPADRHWWFIAETDGSVDLCGIDPGFDVDLYVSSDLRTMTAVWMGYESLDLSTWPTRRSISSATRTIASSIRTWIGSSGLAAVERKVCWRIIPARWTGCPESSGRGALPARATACR